MIVIVLKIPSYIMCVVAVMINISPSQCTLIRGPQLSELLVVNMREAMKMSASAL